MTSPTASAAVWSIGALMALSYGGVSAGHFLIGSGCYMVGACCRFAIKISKAAEANEPVKFAGPMIVLCMAPFLAMFSSMVVFMAAGVLHFEGDAGIGLFLAVSATYGWEGIQWIVSIVSKALPQRLGGAEQETPP